MQLRMQLQAGWARSWQLRPDHESTIVKYTHVIPIAILIAYMHTLTRTPHDLHMHPDGSPCMHTYTYRKAESSVELLLLVDAAATTAVVLAEQLRNGVLSRSGTRCGPLRFGDDVLKPAGPWEGQRQRCGIRLRYRPWACIVMAPDFEPSAHVASHLSATGF